MRIPDDTPLAQGNEGERPFLAEDVILSPDKRGMFFLGVSCSALNSALFFTHQKNKEEA